MENGRLFGLLLVLSVFNSHRLAFSDDQQSTAQFMARAAFASADCIIVGNAPMKGLTPDLVDEMGFITLPLSSGAGTVKITAGINNPIENPVGYLFVGITDNSWALEKLADTTMYYNAAVFPGFATSMTDVFKNFSQTRTSVNSLKNAYIQMNFGKRIVSISCE